MSDWTGGYVSEVDYTHGYYRELSPNLLKFASLSQGAAPPPDGRPRRYLELGYGQGLSLAIHAAACPGEYWGTDFNPAHTANARDLLAGAGLTAHILNDSFSELAARIDELPEFDFIVLHGIWSWISEENRAQIVELARRRLAVGGLFYISYNCTPGWSAAMPLRHLLSLHAQMAGADDQGISRKVESAVKFCQQVVDAGGMYFKANPGVAERLKNIAGQDRKYLAHEYFNRDWLPMPFSQVAELLSPAKLEFLASAHLLDQVESVNLTPAMRELMAQIAHPLLRQSVRDYLINTQFRKDIFTKGARRLTIGGQYELISNMRFVLALPASEVPMKFPGLIGEISLQEELYAPMLTRLGEEGDRAKGFGELLAAMQEPNPQNLTQMLIVLAGAGYLYPVQDEATIAAARPGCAALNRHLWRRARHGGEVNFAASPVIGGGVALGRFPQLFLLARAQGKATPMEWAASVWETLLAQGQRLLKDGTPIMAEEENIAELNRQAQAFAEKQLPVLQALGVA